MAFIVEAIDLKGSGQIKSVFESYEMMT